MIGPLIERAARRAAQADAVEKSDETLTLEFAGGRATSAWTSRARGTSLRLLVEGRPGVAGCVDEDPDGLVERALAAAALAEPTVLSLPFQTTLPSVVTYLPRAAAASVAELARLCELLRDRLAPTRADLRMTLERSVGSVRVANTRGVDASYDVSLVTLAVEAVRYLGDRRVAVAVRLSGADLPSLRELEQVVAMLDQRLEWTRRDATLTPGRQRVLVLPTAIAALLLPVEQALTGKAALSGTSPMAGRRGARIYSELISLSDDPLVDGRPGSRPLDDEGVPSRMLSVVRAGNIEGLIYDLDTASRVGATPTGHGRRAVFGKPQPAWSNLLLEPGSARWEDLLAAVGDGLVVERVGSAGPANRVGGTIALPATLGWRVEGGEITGLAPEVTVAGNAHDLLNRVLAVGREAIWVGSRCAPPIVVDGVSVF